MRVLVDTSVWSLALRRMRPGPPTITRELAELIREGRVVVIGAIRQELLSGLRSPQQFEKLREYFGAFPDLEVTTVDCEHAARLFNQCRASGVQCSNTDLLMCAVAIRHGFAIFTTDDDFVNLHEVIAINLHASRP